MTPSHVYYRYTTARSLAIRASEGPDALRAGLDLDAHDRGLLDVRVLTALVDRIVVAAQKTPFSTHNGSLEAKHALAH